jgi:hypothetical protein
MKDFKLKIIGPKATLTSTEAIATRKTFSELGELVLYVKRHNLTIVNPEVLPPVYRAQLTTEI